MMIRARTRIALCSILLACVITCPRLALAVAPSITGPVFATYLADVTAGTVEITMLELTGENFGTPTLSGPTSSRWPASPIRRPRPRSKAWQEHADHRADLPHDHLRQCDGNHGERFGVEGNRPGLCAHWYDMPTGPPDGPSLRSTSRPILVAVCGSTPSITWRSRWWTPRSRILCRSSSRRDDRPALRSPTPPDAVRHSPSTEPLRRRVPAQRAPERTRAVAAKPSASTARANRFPESGPPQSRESTGAPNRSRLTMYDPSTNTWRAYALPGATRGSTESHSTTFRTRTRSGACGR